tara:strand:+ start:4313 stop:5068 length:756 start_codon:yes stop_codon:yes gene_type:complete
LIYLFGISSIAFLYSIVGHAGASGYIACMVIFGTPVEIIKPTALILNVSVSSLNSIRFLRDGHLDKKTYINFLIPILIFSIPSAMLGAYLKIPSEILKVFLSIILFLSAIRFLFGKFFQNKIKLKLPKLPKPRHIALTGILLGFASGITGTGGGIFLTPLSILLNWMPIKTVAAVSSIFIFFNSSGGLASWLISNNISDLKSINNITIQILIALFFASIGSWLGSKKIGENEIKIILSLILFFASYKLIIS